jgi:hypothetical protein
VNAEGLKMLKMMMMKAAKALLLTLKMMIMKALLLTL